MEGQDLGTHAGKILCQIRIDFITSLPFTYIAGYHANRSFHAIFLTNQAGGGHHGLTPSVDSQVMPPDLDPLVANLYFTDQQRKFINGYSAC